MHMLARLLPTALAVCLLVTAAIAQTTPPTRVRGTIAAIDGPTMTVATREGPKVDVTLNDPLTVLTVKRVELASIASGTYVGIASRTGTNGELRAIEVLVFPEAMRGSGEGQIPWDLEPGSMMTNGTVTATVEGTSERELTVLFKGASSKIVVAPDAALVSFAPAERADLKVGEKVFCSAAKSAEGKLVSSRVTVGKNGVAPPM
jgi:hypothetical protein